MSGLFDLGLKLGLAEAKSKEPAMKEWKLAKAREIAERAMKNGVIEVDAEEVRREFCETFNIPPGLSEFFGFTSKLVCKGLAKTINKHFGDRVVAKCKGRGIVKRRYLVVVKKK